MGQIVLLASGNGGSGKTTLTVNLAHIYAGEGLKTLVLDLNQGLRNADIYMGIENNVIFDLGDVVGGVCRLEKAIAEDIDKDDLYMLCCPQYRFIEADAESCIPKLYSMLREKFDMVVIDAPAGAGKLLSAAALGVDRSVVVLNPDHLSLRNGDTVDRRLEDSGIADRSFVLNRVIPELWESGFVPGLEQITRTMRCRIAGIISEDLDIHIGNNRGVPCASDPGSYLYGVFKKIALNIGY